MRSILSALCQNQQVKPYGWTSLIQEKPNPTFAACSIRSNVGNLFKTPHVSRCIVPKHSEAGWTSSFQVVDEVLLSLYLLCLVRFLMHRAETVLKGGWSLSIAAWISSQKGCDYCDCHIWTCEIPEYFLGRLEPHHSIINHDRSFCTHNNHQHSSVSIKHPSIVPDCYSLHQVIWGFPKIGVPPVSIQL